VWYECGVTGEDGFVDDFFDIPVDLGLRPKPGDDSFYVEVFGSTPQGGFRASRASGAAREQAIEPIESTAGCRSDGVKTLVVVMALVAATAAAPLVGAVEIPFRDGTVVTAESYRLTGSYILVTRADGRQVAYNAADVDIEALKAAEAANSAPEATGEAAGSDAQAAGPSLKSRGHFTGAVAANDRERSSVAITDRDVDHVSDSVEIEEGPAPPDTIPDNFVAGGVMLLVQNFKVVPLDVEAGQYRVDRRGAASRSAAGGERGRSSAER
jgi:hypothetical protein